MHILYLTVKDMDFCFVKWASEENCKWEQVGGVDVFGAKLQRKDRCRPHVRLQAVINTFNLKLKDLMHSHIHTTGGKEKYQW